MPSLDGTLQNYCKSGPGYVPDEKSMFLHICASCKKARRQDFSLNGPYHHNLALLRPEVTLRLAL